MSASPNKENYPETPTKSERIGEHSPTHKRSLKPISPNKATNHTVGRLKFLDSDNIDEHFAYIHSSNEQIQQSLYELEIQTKQTGIDLGQLFERSKNNNQFLNTLLENLSNYSKEVITEGNATKNDITKLIEHLNVNNNKIKELSSNDHLEKLTRMIEERMSISNILEERDSKLKSYIRDIIKSEVNEIAMEDKLKNIFTPIIDEIRSHSNLKLEKDEKEAEKMNLQDLQNSTLDKLNQIIYDISQNNKYSANIDKNLEYQSNYANQSKDVMHKIQNESQDIKESIENHNSQIHDLKSLMENNSVDINEIKKLITLNQTTNELETKISNLENKYELLCEKYENKFGELKSLQNEFQSIFYKTKESQNNVNNLHSIQNINKLRKLHAENMNKISNNNFSESTPFSKRISSAPIGLGLVEEEKIINHTSNSDDEGF